MQRLSNMFRSPTKVENKNQNQKTLAKAGNMLDEPMNNLNKSTTEQTNKITNKLKNFGKAFVKGMKAFRHAMTPRSKSQESRMENVTSSSKSINEVISQSSRNRAYGSETVKEIKQSIATMVDQFISTSSSTSRTNIASKHNQLNSGVLSKSESMVQFSGYLRNTEQDNNFTSLHENFKTFLGENGRLGRNETYESHNQGSASYTTSYKKDSNDSKSVENLFKNLFDISGNLGSMRSYMPEGTR